MHDVYVYICKLINECHNRNKNSKQKYFMYEIQCQKITVRKSSTKSTVLNMSNETASSQTGTKTGNNEKHPNHTEQHELNNRNSTKEY